MKKTYLLLLIFNFIAYSYAQVGIITQSPLGVFHIDPYNDTSALGVNDSDDFIITGDGKVGVGTSNPQATLDIRGKIRIADDTQKNGYALVSNNQGIAHWSEMQTTLDILMDNFSSLGISIPFTPANNSNIGSVKWFYTNSFIKIRPGKQLISACIYSDFKTSDINSGSFKIVYRLSTSPTQLINPNFILANGGQQITGITNFPNFSNGTSGFWLINNTTTSTTNYYLFVAVYFPTSIDRSDILLNNIGSYQLYETIVTVTPLNII